MITITETSVKLEQYYFSQFKYIIDYIFIIKFRITDNLVKFVISHFQLLLIS